VPTVSIDAIAPPPRSFAQSGPADQRDLARPSQFASFLSAQADNPPPAAIEDKPPASPPPTQADTPSRQPDISSGAPASSPPARADTPPHEATNTPSSAQHRQSAGTAEPSSGKAKASAASVTTDRPTATKAKIVSKTVVSASVGPVLLPTASPTPTAQATAANAPPADISMVTAAAAVDAADGVVDATAPSVTDGPGADTSDKASDSGDAATNVAATSDPSQLNSQPGPSAALPAITANPQAIAAVAPAPTGPTVGGEASTDGSGNDPLTVTGDAPGKIDRSPPAVLPPGTTTAPPISSDATATPVAVDASRKTANPISGGDPPQKTNAVPSAESTSLTTVAARTTALPASGIEQTLTTANAGVHESAAPASATIEPDDRPRDVVKASDSSTNVGLAIQTQTMNGPGAAATNNATAAAPPAQSAAAPVPVGEVAVTIAMHAQSGKNRFEIRLDPPELGRIDVQLNVDSRGTVSSRLIVERPDTLNLLARDAPQLQRALQDAGFSTAGGMEFSLADQGFANRNGFAQQNEFPIHRAGGTAGDTAPIAALQEYAARSSRNSGLDIMV
jgi:flagellar hook-length control protein FliK